MQTSGAAFRLAAPPFSFTHRAAAHPLPRPNSAVAKAGLAYERQVKRQLERLAAQGYITEVIHNPWFTFCDSFGASVCAPDFVLLLAQEQRCVVVEVKRTWVPEAQAKLDGLYCPVVAATYAVPTKGIVICRHLTFEAPQAAHTLHGAIFGSRPLVHWPQIGPLLWS
jgi:hypothetical protein